MDYSSVIEVGPVSSQSASKRHYVLAALAGGAVAALLLPAVGPGLLWTTTGTQVTTARMVGLASARSLSTQPSYSSNVEESQPLSQLQVDAPSSSNTSAAPFLFAASGVLLVTAALVRFFRSPATSPEYNMLVATAEKYRLEREMREKQRADQVQREIQERLLRLASMGAYVPQKSKLPSSQTAASGTVNEWEARQQARERMEREKAEAKQREIQERLARLSKLSSTPIEAPQATPSFGGVSEWEMRQQQREQREREIAEAKQLQIQKRLARLASMGALPSAQTTATPPASSSVSTEWERRQQVREQREREIAEAKQREIQERLARLAQLGAAPAPTSTVISSSPVNNDWERRQQERERRESEKAAAARREIEERMARLARLSSGH